MSESFQRCNAGYKVIRLRSLLLQPLIIEAIQEEGPDKIILLGCIVSALYKEYFCPFVVICFRVELVFLHPQCIVGKSS